MKGQQPYTNINSFYIEILNKIAELYWVPLDRFLRENPHLIKTFPAFLLEQEQVVFYLGKTHLAVEYYGNETTENLPEDKVVALTYYDFTASENYFFEDVVGFKYESTAAMPGLFLPMPPLAEDLVFPTNRGLDKLIELKWNFDAQNAILGFNSPPFEIPEGQFTRIVNGRFYDADESGLKTRHIKWMDFLPLQIVNETETDHAFKISLTQLVELPINDAHYQYPLPPKSDYKYSKLPQINRFLELIGSGKHSETDLTGFLEKPENKFILTMGFLATEIHSQLLCEWQSDEKDSIKPDFFVVKPNGYADIVEFKLPSLKTNTVVGKINRETFSAEIHSYIAQTRVYQTYFEDPKNREWIKEKYGLTVRYPRRILVVGRRWHFSSMEWREIMDDHRDLEIMTYDDLTDGVVSQFYM
nr:Shedu anti-phage system protein SduA domain-containing protein [Pedobacter sp. ASV19]